MAPQIKFYKSHRKGAEAEATALAWLLRRGYFVFTNIAGRGCIDLIAVEPTKRVVILIDVKAVSRTKLKRGGTYVQPRQLTEDQQRLGVRILMVDLDHNTCSFEDPNDERKITNPSPDGDVEY